ncbi:hypothetical protein I33_1941 [Bacillus subtilis subsp. subtilis str. RO-NN-1]|nr:hypothetical protein I33_1941 [Bacillus subtilis subsp. subtilis str. RO-NN-1]
MFPAQLLPAVLLFLFKITFRFNLNSKMLYLSHNWLKLNRWLSNRLKCTPI